jgi:hypothetical protein
MGRTTQTITGFLDQFESDIFGPFTNSATPAERRVISKLFVSARRHVTAISMTGHLLPFETTLMAMMLEQQRQLAEIEAKLRKKRR